jgi:pantetheine-phosphate adenylyltransferase
MKVAIYPGTFDPITNGHIDVVERALKIFDTIYILVAHNLDKKTMFTIAERIDMVKHIYKDSDNIIVRDTAGLIADFAREIGAIAIIRGLRAISDFEYELQMAHINRKLNNQIESIFFMPALKYSFVSSTLVKDIILHGGNVESFVTKYVENKLEEKYNAIR